MIRGSRQIFNNILVTGGMGLHLTLGLQNASILVIVMNELGSVGPELRIPF